MSTLRRNSLVLLLLPPLVAMLAAVVSAQRTSTYQSAAQLLLLPGDSRETFDSVGRPDTRFVDRAAHAQAQVAVVRSGEVAEQAAQVLGVTPEQVAKAATVEISKENTTLTITCTGDAAAFTKACADEVAKAYIGVQQAKAVRGVSAALENLGKEIDSVESELARLAPDADVSTNINGVTTNVAARADYEAALQRYNRLVDRRSELTITGELKQGEAEITNLAQLPLEPTSPNPKQAAILGLLGGAFAAALIAQLRSRLDSKIRTAADIEAVSGHAVLAVVPEHNAMKASPGSVPMTVGGSSLFAERIRDLRAALKFVDLGADARAIMVTSTAAGEGKSVISENLAAACAQAGQKVLLVVGDLRVPSTGGLIGAYSHTDGLSELLGDLAASGNLLTGEWLRERIERAVRPTGISKLSILPAGAGTTRPAELLSGPQLGMLLRALKAEYDLVIIDVPPVGVVSDARLVAAHCDTALYVVRSRRTDVQAFRRGFEALASMGVRVAGIVVNREKVDHPFASYSAAYDSGKPSRRMLEPMAVGAQGRNRP